MSSGEPRETAAEGSLPRIVQTDDVLGGQPRIEGRRVGVYTVYSKYQRTDGSVAETAAAYRLSEAEVHAAVAYAKANPEQMEAIAERARTLYEQHASDGLTPENA